MKYADLELYHYSNEPLLAVQNANEREGGRIDVYFKPRGLWVSVKGENDWPSWCESENFIDISKQYETRVILAEDANLLVLSSPFSLDGFTERFLAAPRYKHDRSIDWPLVQSRYDGIVIAPYCWERRMSEHTFWYYPWDCASGCIWNASAVASVALSRLPSAVTAPEVPQ